MFVRHQRLLGGEIGGAMSILEPRVGLAPEGPKGSTFHTAPDKDTVSRKQQYIIVNLRIVE